MTHQERVERLKLYYAEGRLIRNMWTDATSAEMSGAVLGVTVVYEL